VCQFTHALIFLFLLLSRELKKTVSPWDIRFTYFSVFLKEYMKIKGMSTNSHEKNPWKKSS